MHGNDFYRYYLNYGAMSLTYLLNLKHVALTVPEMIAKNGQSLDTPMLPILFKKFDGLLFG